jgi:flagellin-specific chaperone FliS
MSIKLYQHLQVDSSTPLNRLILLHQVGIDAAIQHDQIKLNKVLLLLNKKINKTSQPQLAHNLKRIYQHLLACTEQSDFEQVISIFERLQQDWQDLNKLS